MRNGKATWTFVPNGRWVNTFRYGLDTDREADAFDQAELGGGLGYLDVSVAGVQLGPANYLPRVEPLEVRNEFADDVSWVKGNHMVKFGFTFEHVQDDVNYLSNRFGSYTYPTVTSFALDYTGNTTGARNYSAFSQTFGNPVVDYAIKDIGFYLQDQWRVSDRLTVTFGARYEHTFAPPPPAANPLYPLTGASLHTGPMDLMPRFGFAYRVNDKTVIRGGLGTFFARLVGGMLDDVYTGSRMYPGVADNLSNATLIAQGPVFPNALGAPLTSITQSASTLDVLSPHLKTPYSEQATIAVERQLAKDMVLTVSGIFSRGVNLLGTQDINAPALGAPFTYTINNATGQQVGTYTTGVYTGARPNPNFGAIYEETNGISSSYNGLVVAFDKRFGHGFQSQGSYTWSHEIDDGQGAATNAIFGFSDQLWTYNGLYGFDKGSGSLDQRQRFVLLLCVGASVHPFDWLLCEIRCEQLAAFEHHDDPERPSADVDHPHERHSGDEHVIQRVGSRRVQRKFPGFFPAGEQLVLAVVADGEFPADEEHPSASRRDAPEPQLRGLQYRQQLVAHGLNHAGLHRGERRADLHSDGFRRGNGRWRVPGWYAGAPAAGFGAVYFLSRQALAPQD